MMRGGALDQCGEFLSAHFGDYPSATDSIEYNTERPHQVVKYGSPAAFGATWQPPKEATDERIG